MTVPGEVVRTRGRRRFSGAKAAIFFIWVILIFSELGLLLGLHEETGESPPRKTRFFDTAESFHAPPSVGQLVDTQADNPGKLYEDDKRIIHTGPNPLHN